MSGPSATHGLVTIITPTTGRASLLDLIASVKEQGVPVVHLLLWDDKRDPGAGTPCEIEESAAEPAIGYTVSCIALKGRTVVGGVNPGSALRAVGLMAAQTEYITFADDDVRWEKNHLMSMLDGKGDRRWGFCKRKIWAGDRKALEYLGRDDFESVGEEAITPYRMVDNNCMLFDRELGVAGARLYRETQEYNDDRLMYAFLKRHGGEPFRTNTATVNQICPPGLIGFFRANCTREAS